MMHNNWIILKPDVRWCTFAGGSYRKPYSKLFRSKTKKKNASQESTDHGCRSIPIWFFFFMLNLREQKALYKKNHYGENKVAMMTKYNSVQLRRTSPRWLAKLHSSLEIRFLTKNMPETLKSFQIFDAIRAEVMQKWPALKTVISVLAAN